VPVVSAYRARRTGPEQHPCNSQWYAVHEMGSTMCLETVAADRDVDVQVVCEKSGDDLGVYFGGRRMSDGLMILAERGGFTRTSSLPVGARHDLLRGPRTQAGLFLESFGGNVYMRKRCGCGCSNIKRSLATIATMPLTVRSDGTYLLAF
jgi:hypothetical protein